MNHYYFLWPWTSMHGGWSWILCRLSGFAPAAAEQESHCWMYIDLDCSFGWAWGFIVRYSSRKSIISFSCKVRSKKPPLTRLFNTGQAAKMTNCRWSKTTIFSNRFACLNDTCLYLQQADLCWWTCIVSWSVLPAAVAQHASAFPQGTSRKVPSHAKSPSSVSSCSTVWPMQIEISSSIKKFNAIHVRLSWQYSIVVSAPSSVALNSRPSRPVGPGSKNTSGFLRS